MARDDNGRFVDTARAFPFFAHRTLAEVIETERLAHQPTLTAQEAQRLDFLMWKAERHNPPAEPAPGSAA